MATNFLTLRRTQASLNWRVKVSMSVTRITDLPLNFWNRWPISPNVDSMDDLKLPNAELYVVSSAVSSTPRCLRIGATKLWVPKWGLLATTSLTNKVYCDVCAYIVEKQ